MYVLKELPEDFIVEEVVDLAPKENGNYLLLKVTKGERNTEEVAMALAKYCRIHRKDVGYAGTKDKKAVTTQHFTINGKKKKDLAKFEMVGVKVEFLGYLDEPLALGLLEGNRFTIVVRAIEQEEEIQLPKVIPNYFDEQRFSSNNARIGEALVRKEFKAAVQLVVEKDRLQGARVKEFLDEHPTDFVGAIRLLPHTTLKLYLHAFQSRLWNEIVNRYVEDMCDTSRRITYSQGSLSFSGKNDAIAPKAIPLPGFGVESDDPTIQKYLDDVMKMNSLSPRDFVIRQLPNLSLEGTERDAFMRVDDFTIGEFEEDELHPGKKKVTLRFTLGKGSYATMLVKALFI